MSSTGDGTTERGAPEKPDLLAGRIYSQCHITRPTVVGSVSKKELSIVERTEQPETFEEIDAVE
jgi:hypothetical protein